MTPPSLVWHHYKQQNHYCYNSVHVTSSKDPCVTKPNHTSMQHDARRLFHLTVRAQAISRLPGNWSNIAFLSDPKQIWTLLAGKFDLSARDGYFTSFSHIYIHNNNDALIVKVLQWLCFPRKTAADWSGTDPEPEHRRTAACYDAVTSVKGKLPPGPCRNHLWVYH